MDFTDYYAVLGVKPDASQEEIKRAFKVLARKYHPDVSTEEDAQAKFQGVSEAYEILKDAEKRAEYDELRAYVNTQGRSGSRYRQSAGGGEEFDINSLRGDARFEDILNSIFGQRGFDAGGFDAGFGAAGANRGFAGGFGGGRARRSRRGDDLRTVLQLTLEEAHSGGEKQLHLQTPQGDKTIKVQIPKAIQAGKELRLRGQGEPGSEPGSSGDLFLKIELLPHRNFQLEGQNIVYVLPLPPWDAALGCQVEVPTLSGRVKITIPENSQNGQRLRLKGKGLTKEGDQMVMLKLINPPVQSATDRAAFEALRDSFPQFSAARSA